MVVLPKANEKDLVEVPDEVREALEVHAIDHVDAIFELALIGYDSAPEPPPPDVEAGDATVTPPA